MTAPANLLLFGHQQRGLPGIPTGGAPAPASRADAVPEPAPAPRAPLPGQLVLGPSQLLLAEVDPEPRQPSLLPEPPPWETVDTVPRIRPAPSPRPRTGPRQLRLFSLKIPRLTT